MEIRTCRSGDPLPYCCLVLLSDDKTAAVKRSLAGTLGNLVLVI